MHRVIALVGSTAHMKSDAYLLGFDRYWGSDEEKTNPYPAQSREWTDFEAGFAAAEEWDRTHAQ